MIPSDGISYELFFDFDDDGCRSLVDEMSKAFLGSMGALKVHEECQNKEVLPALLEVMK